MIKVAVFGAAGRMGAEVCRAVSAAEGMDLVCAVDPPHQGKSIFEMTSVASDLVICGSSEDVLAAGADVAVDFTVATSAFENILWCVGNGVHIVVGTTGFAEAEMKEIEQLAEKGSANVLVAPNFAIGAVLMMQFARRAARWLPDAEVIELHHPGKLDSPSGTAQRTAEYISEGRDAEPTAWAQQLGAKQTITGARGAELGKVPIHSVRLPGLVAHQEVLFGGEGQTLSIRHDSIDRTSFMPGVLLAIRGIVELRGLTLGIDGLLEK